MATTISNGESGSSVRTKLNNIWEGLQINEISETISDTAVDVFVYDTRKDSDGGAWRKRTQHTSWYNETLNTATRGSRKEFPAVAVIVAEQGDVTIYDGDDPDLPMWMVFQSGGGWNAKIIAGTTATNNLAAMNGMLSIGTTPNSQGVLVVSFIEDMTRAYLSATNYGGTDTAPLSLRNTTGHTFAENVAGGSNLPVIVNNSVNDVAMTVLPNAPIDAATGLPVPTIAVATDGGVSVIKDDGTVVDSGSTNVEWVMFDEDTLYFEYTNSAKYQLISALADGFTGFDFAESLVTTPIYAHGSVSTNSNAVIENNTIAVGNNAASGGGLGIYHKGRDDINYGTLAQLDSEYRQAVITSSYNTGWMNGDIKLATLSDTYDYTLDPLTLNNVTGSELVTNGDFTTDTSGWTDASTGTGSISWNSSEYLQLNSTDSDNRGIAKQSFATEVGKVYTFTFEQVAGTEIALRLGTTDTGSQYYNHPDDAVGVYAATFTATNTTLYITIYGPQSSANTQVDNISVRLAEEDRSVNGNGLQVFGTVDKDPVATGADLVAYSGFSSSNYLVQPYNSDLDFGTGDFCVMGWIKTSTSGRGRIAHLQNVDGTVPYSFAVDVYDGDLRYFSYGADTGATVLIGGAINTNTWTFFTAKRTKGIVSLWINGVPDAYSSIADPIGGNSNSYELGIGNDPYYASHPVDASLALLRISATAPSPEQIARIYNDEKHLFTEGAQATLYGSSDSVTALAYDDTTNLLHVGTSAGRSVFQGLRRVDNTTTAVTSAISASNGLVADE